MCVTPQKPSHDTRRRAGPSTQRLMQGLVATAPMPPGHAVITYGHPQGEFKRPTDFKGAIIDNEFIPPPSNAPSPVYDHITGQFVHSELGNAIWERQVCHCGKEYLVLRTIMDLHPGQQIYVMPEQPVVGTGHCVVLQFDGSCLDAGQIRPSSGAGVVLWLIDGKGIRIIDTISAPLPNVDGAPAAEAVGCALAILLYLKNIHLCRHVHKVILQGDNLALQNFWKGEGRIKDLALYKRVELAVKLQQFLIPGIEVVHIPRKLNPYADYLADMASAFARKLNNASAFAILQDPTPMRMSTPIFHPSSSHVVPKHHIDLLKQIVRQLDNLVAGQRSRARLTSQSSRTINGYAYNNSTSLLRDPFTDMSPDSYSHPSMGPCSLNTCPKDHSDREDLSPSTQEPKRCARQRDTSCSGKATLNWISFRLTTLFLPHSCPQDFCKNTHRSATPLLPGHKFVGNSDHLCTTTIRLLHSPRTSSRA